MKKQNRFSRPNSVTLISSLVAGLLLFSVLIACRGFSSKAKCTGEVTYQGETFTGVGDNAEQAQLFACNGYCLNADPEFDAHYGIWYESPAGAAAGHPPKKEAIYKDKELLDYLTKTCASKCVARVKEGKLKGETKCR